MCRCREKLYHYLDKQSTRLRDEVNLGMGTDGELYSTSDVKNNLKGQLAAYVEIKFFIERELRKYNVKDS
tara:strand:+ start:66 stop:275 length:210 start_codon:yes stop_codon:yes gene_type:complete